MVLSSISKTLHSDWFWPKSLGLLVNRVCSDVECTEAVHYGWLDEKRGRCRVIRSHTTDTQGIEHNAVGHKAFASPLRFTPSSPHLNTNNSFQSYHWSRSRISAAARHPTAALHSGTLSPTFSSMSLLTLDFCSNPASGQWENRQSWPGSFTCNYARNPAITASPCDIITLQAITGITQKHPLEANKLATYLTRFGVELPFENKSRFYFFRPTQKTN